MRDAYQCGVGDLLGASLLGHTVHRALRTLHPDPCRYTDQRVDNFSTISHVRMTSRAGDGSTASTTTRTRGRGRCKRRTIESWGCSRMAAQTRSKGAGEGVYRSQQVMYGAWNVLRMTWCSCVGRVLASFAFFALRCLLVSRSYLKGLCISWSV